MKVLRLELEAVDGQPPIRVSTFQSQTWSFAQRPELTPALSRVILRCLEKDPADRFPNARALRRALDEVAVRA